MVNPRDFNGQFFFTNPDSEDFTAMWNGTAYTFPAMKTSPLIIVDATPIETQSIRKQFAEKLARRMFGKTPKWKGLMKESAKLAKEGKVSQPFYDQTKELTPFIQQCLEPLPVAETKIGKQEKEPIQKSRYTRVLQADSEGRSDTSLMEEARNAQ